MARRQVNRRDTRNSSGISAMASITALRRSAPQLHGPPRHASVSRDSEIDPRGLTNMHHLSKVQLQAPCRAMAAYAVPGTEDEVLRVWNSEGSMNYWVRSSSMRAFEQLLPTRCSRSVLYSSRQNQQEQTLVFSNRPREGERRLRVRLGPGSWGDARGHSITSSTDARKVGETARPKRFAVLRLRTSSKRIDCMTGMSAGFAPLRIWPM